MIFIPGLSLIIHLFIILIGAIYPTERFYFPKLTKKMNNLLAFFFFFMISFIVLSGAVFYFKSAFAGESNIKLAQRLLKKEPVAVLASKKDDKKLIYLCKTLTPQQETTLSIADFLDSQQKDNLFEARKILANQFSIQNYQGTAEQNLKLLTLLRQQSFTNCLIEEKGN